MELFIMRHGEAVHRPGPDEERELSLVGENQVARMARHCATDIEQADLILVSPFVRARQTATLMLAGSRHIARTDAGLQPEASPQMLAEQLQALSCQRVWLICHMPLAGALVDWLLTADRRGVTRVDTAEIIYLRADQWSAGCAELVWRRTPQGIAP